MSKLSHFLTEKNTADWNFFLYIYLSLYSFEENQTVKIRNEIAKTIKPEKDSN